MNKIHKINKKPPPIATLNSKNLLSIEGMNKLEINSLLDRADYFADLDPLKIIKTLNGYVILNVFFENSTRTRVSFELAGRLLLKPSADFAFQNFFSKSSVEALILLNNLNLSNINAHEKIELAIRRMITNLTTKSARKKSFNKEKSELPPKPTT